MQQPAPQAKVILPNVQIYNNDCWLQTVVMLCYYNQDTYQKVMDYKGNIPFLLHLRNMFNEIKSLKFLYDEREIVSMDEFYKKLATLMLETTEKLKNDTVVMSRIFADSRDLYQKDAFYDPYNCIYAINTIFKMESNNDKDIIGDGIDTLPAQAPLINNSNDIEFAIALNESINQNVMFFHFPGHWTTAIRNKDGKFLYYDNTIPYKSDGKIHYFDGEQMQKYYIWDINKLISICPSKEDNQKKQQVTNLKNYYPNNQIKK